MADSEQADEALVILSGVSCCGHFRSLLGAPPVARMAPSFL